MSNRISIDDAKDRILGKIGTDRRDKYEQELREDIYYCASCLAMFEEECCCGENCE